MDILATNAALSPEADQFLENAISEFNAKQDALKRDWHFDSFDHWDYDQFSGVFRLVFADGSQIQADAQILGSYDPGDHTWEWAWNNPEVESIAVEGSRRVRDLGERLEIEYLKTGFIPISDAELVWHLTAIGIKATDSMGAFRGDAGPVEVILMLKNLRK